MSQDDTPWLWGSLQSSCVLSEGHDRGWELPGPMSVRLKEQPLQPWLEQLGWGWLGGTAGMCLGTVPGGNHRLPARALWGEHGERCEATWAVVCAPAGSSSRSACGE